MKYAKIILNIKHKFVNTHYTFKCPPIGPGQWFGIFPY